MAHVLAGGRGVTFGEVTIECPGCGRTVRFAIHASGPTTGANGEPVTGLTLDVDAVAAHLLTHGSHDGEPLPVAA